jgi:(E)-4-hydroxy-3-methylbut-2-enyl-diphosphate synthase
MDYNAYRRKTKEIKVGTLSIGGSAKISVQSMTNTPAEDFEKTFIQVKSLVDCGCDIVRISTPTVESCEVFKYIKARGITAPLVADIHFNHEIALRAVECGADKIRINPGNIGSNDKVKSVVSACLERDIPIRIGVNAGSLEKELLCKYGAPVPEALVESALRHIDILEKENYDKIIVSIKASNVQDMIAANRLLAEKVNYPLHLGVTESGSKLRGTVKSSVGIGALLLKGIGDTIRVSLTGDPVSEVETAKMILGSLGLKSDGVEIVSCPTCSRCEYDMESIVDTLENSLKDVKKQVKVAVMGCVVNGPGEAKGADIALCGGGQGKTALYFKGQVVKTIDQRDAVKEILLLIDKL